MVDMGTHQDQLGELPGAKQEQYSTYVWVTKIKVSVWCNVERMWKLQGAIWEEYGSYGEFTGKNMIAVVVLVRTNIVPAWYYKKSMVPMGVLIMENMVAARY